MPVINYIRVPFISAFSIDDYLETLSMGITPSGEYIEGRIALDNFTGYVTGFRNFYSGSGYWLTSGTSIGLLAYFSDDFVPYSTGIYQYDSLNQGFVYQNLIMLSGSTTGALMSVTNYMTDSFTGYATGLYSGATLTLNLTQRNYFIYQGLTTGSFNLIS